MRFLLALPPHALGGCIGSTIAIIGSITSLALLTLLLPLVGQPPVVLGAEEGDHGDADKGDVAGHDQEEPGVVAAGEERVSVAQFSAKL